MSTVVAKHAFTSGKADGADASKVRASNWNADHALSGVGIALDQNVTADWTLPSSKNVLSAGPVTIDTGITVTVPDGTNWVVV